MCESVCECLWIYTSKVKKKWEEHEKEEQEEDEAEVEKEEEGVIMKCRKEKNKERTTPSHLLSRQLLWQFSSALHDKSFKGWNMSPSIYLHHYFSCFTVLKQCLQLLHPFFLLWSWRGQGSFWWCRFISPEPETWSPVYSWHTHTHTRANAHSLVTKRGRSSVFQKLFFHSSVKIDVC